MVGIPLKHIVESFLIEQGYDSKHKYLQYLHLAIDGLRELEWDISGATKLETLTADDQGIINLPEDFVKEVRIAVVDNSGELVSLSRNNDIVKVVNDCGQYAGNQTSSFVTEGTTTTNAVWESSTEHYNKGQFIGRFYGVGGESTEGQYTIKDGMLWLGKGVDHNNIVLEYIGYMPPRVGGQFMVHPFLKEPLMNWMQYASMRRLKSTPAGTTQFLHKRYIASKNWAKQRFYNMDYTEVLDIARKNFTQAPKR